jgi:hypothetical protein
MSTAAKCLLTLVIAVVLIGLALLNRQAGYDEGFRVAKAEGDKALSDYRTGIESDARKAAETAALNLATEAKRGDSLAAQLVAKNIELRKHTEQLNGEIARVTTLYRRALDTPPEPLPAVVFTTGFVRVWNSAISPDAVLPGKSTGDVVASAGGAGAADQLASGITQRDLLTNHVRNSEKYASCRAQLKSLIEWNTHGRI